MDGERARMTERVEKLLALSRSDNPHEAAAALAKATSLMERYAIRESELGRKRGEQPHSGHDPLIESEVAAPRQWWREELASKIGEATGCFAYMRFETDRYALCLSGCDSDVALARRLFGWCLHEVERIGLSAGPHSTPRYRAGLVLGAVDRVCAEIEEERRRTREDLFGAVSSSALVVVDQRAAAARDVLGEIDSTEPTEVDAEERGRRVGFHLARGLYGRGRREGVEGGER